MSSVGALSIVVRICIVAVFIEHVDVHVWIWYVEVPIFAVSMEDPLLSYIS